jgi:hypothetical protein
MATKIDSVFDSLQDEHTRTNLNGYEHVKWLVSGKKPGEGVEVRHKDSRKGGEKVSCQTKLLN